MACLASPACRALFSFISSESARSYALFSISIKCAVCPSAASARSASSRIDAALQVDTNGQGEKRCDGMYACSNAGVTQRQRVQVCAIVHWLEENTLMKACWQGLHSIAVDIMIEVGLPVVGGEPDLRPQQAPLLGAVEHLGVQLRAACRRCVDTLLVRGCRHQAAPSMSGQYQHENARAA